MPRHRRRFGRDGGALDLLPLEGLHLVKGPLRLGDSSVGCGERGLPGGMGHSATPYA